MLSQRVAEAFDAWFARLAAARGVRLVVVGRADVLRLTVSKRHARGGKPREPRVERLGDALREHPPEADRARLSVATTVDLRRGGALSPPRV